jgi:hypothetical protein
MVAVVRLYAPHLGASGTLAVDFERELFLRTLGEAKTKAALKKAILVAQQQVKLTGAGKLTIVVKRAGGNLSTKPSCRVPADEKQAVLDVEGSFYFSVGVAPVFSWEKSRVIKARQGDDGINRIVVDDNHELDVLLTLVAYPWGVRYDTVFSVGLVAATSLANPFRSFYFGLQPSFPVIGMGIVGGVGVHVLDELEDDLAEGQPWPDNTDVPTQVGAKPGWFVGVNVEDTLFRKVFGEIFEDDDAD